MPAWGNRVFAEIRRGDVAALLDRVEDNAGPVAADKVLAHVSALCNWYAARHDDYASPVVKGMRRSKPKERARERILSDDEIRAVWQTGGGERHIRRLHPTRALDRATAGEGRRDAMARSRDRWHLDDPGGSTGEG